MRRRDFLLGSAGAGATLLGALNRRSYGMSESQGPITTLVKQFLESTRYPAIYVGVAKQESIIAEIALGTRRLGFPEEVNINDKLMVGSVSKPITGTLIAVLIDQGVLSWNTTVRSVFPKLGGTVDRPWFDATILQLMTHLSGAPPNPAWVDPSVITDKTGLRKHFLDLLVQAPGSSNPGTKYVYGSGHLIASCMAEEKTGRSFENLLTERLFLPLGIRNGGIGSPIKSDSDRSQPWGHVRWVDSGETISKNRTDNNVTLEFNPSGGIHMSVRELLRFGQWHATNGKTAPNLMRPSVLAESRHRPFNECMATGFWAGNSESYGHNGLTGSHWTMLTIYSDGSVIVVHTNMAEGPLKGDYAIPWPDSVVGPLTSAIRELLR